LFRIYLFFAFLLGLNYLQTEKIDLVLLDFLMPVMSGPEMMTNLKEWRDKSHENASFNSETLIIGTNIIVFYPIICLSYA